MAVLDSDAYLGALRDQAEQLVAAAERAGLDAPVPSCPDWDVAELLGHMGRVYRWAASCVETNAPASPKDLPAPPARDERAGWMRDGLARVVAALDRPAGDPAWTWAPDGTVGFWQRRQAHETTIHRVDAELAGGPPSPVPLALAVDGIDEWLALVPNRRGVPPVTGHGETIHLHCTDTDGEWLVRVGEDGLAVERAHAKGDVAARGAASDLLLVLLRRLPPATVEVLGDPGVLDGFLTLTRF